METERVPLDGWAIVEVMGHNRYAGKVSEHVIGGSAFVRVDVPASNERPAFSKLFGAGSIYAITPVDELVARGIAAKLGQTPVDVWDLPEAWREKILDRGPRPLLAEAADDDDGPF